MTTKNPKESRALKRKEESKRYQAPKLFIFFIFKPPNHT